ncbi:hypothetical protein [Vibrio nereis]|uniref:DUF333 domain-containing protein n=1 Tax=Vibrio nereis TaxID=693 RepID=A0A0M0HK65_VIBNE|nr:hypothetical protein [Vibrio nereis]KOO02197.1 hypothetical protein AKJ17_16495 [Vibrio nereis]
MKSLIVLLVGFGVAVFGANANTMNSTGSTQLGPLVQCEMPNGEQKYIPVEMCRLQGGKS